MKGSWTVVTPGTKPAGRWYHGMAYSAADAKIVLFGGEGSSSNLQDTWFYTTGSNTWAAQSPAAKPSARHGHSMATIDGVVHLFGGTDGSLQQDLWKWSSSNWSEYSEVTKPDARKFAGLAQSATDQILLWGGHFDGGAFDPNTWIYDIGSGWTEIVTHTVPTARSMHACFYDPVRATVIIFGGLSYPDGRPLNDMWEWNGVDWHVVTLGTVAPAQRACWQAAVYDVAKQHLLVPSTGLMAQGSISSVHAKYINDEETFSISDGVHSTAAFEFNRSKYPTDVINIGPDIALKFDLTSLLGTTDQSGLDIKLECLLTSTSETVTSTYSGGVNYAQSTGLLGQSAPPSNQPTDYKISTAITAGNEVDIGPYLPEDDVRDVILTAINAASSLDVTAFADPDDTGRVLLFNDIPGSHGNNAINETVAYAGFVVTGMDGADSDVWIFNRSNGFWSRVYDEGVVPIYRGAAAAYDATASQIVLFGGKDLSAVLQAQYVWSWSTAGLSPYFSNPGVLQGRIQPQFATAPNGNWVMCLGADVESLPEYDLMIGDSIYVEQSFSITGHKLLRFAWRMRYSRYMPQYAVIIPSASGAVDFYAPVGPGNTSGLVKIAGDRLIGLKYNSSVFTNDHAGRHLRITGSTDVSNNGTFRSGMIPSGQGDVGYFDPNKDQGAISAGRCILLENPMMVKKDDDSAVQVEMLGAQWRAQLFVDTGSGPILRTELVEQAIHADPDGWQRAMLAAHVSKIDGTATVTFKLSLEEVTS